MTGNDRAFNKATGELAHTYALEARAVTFSYTRRSAILGPIDLQISEASLLGIIGPNGAGKSTLLRIFAGLLTPGSGEVLLDGRSLSSASRGERARRIAFLPQNLGSQFSMTARQVVLRGRYPHGGGALFESALDENIADEAMSWTETRRFANRPLCTLSGGEAQCVHLAAALAQEPAVLLLDEPTASLDLYHQELVFRKLIEWRSVRRTAIVVVTHDINLAGQYCDRLLLMADGRTVAEGRSDEVLSMEAVERVYAVNVQRIHVPGRARPWMVPGAAGP